VFTNEVAWSTDVKPTGQRINGPKNYLVAGPDTVSLCVTTISMVCLHQNVSQSKGTVCTIRFCTVRVWPINGYYF